MIVNGGRISVADMGLAALVAPGVANRGVITARLTGNVTVHAASFTHGRAARSTSASRTWRSPAR